MIPMILIKLLMALCQLMRLPIRQSSRCTSMDISVTPINWHYYERAWYCSWHHFLQQGLLKKHPDIVVGKKSDSPDEDKSLADSKALLPVFNWLFQKHPLINPRRFLEMLRLMPLTFTNPSLKKLAFKKLYPFKNKAFCGRNRLYCQWKRYSLRDFAFSTVYL